jgi:hypothetical protein
MRILENQQFIDFFYLKSCSYILRILQYGKGKKRVDKSNKGEIMKNATINYIDGVSEKFEAIRIIDKGVIIGRILDKKFLICGFISKRNIKEIINSE